MEESGKNGTGLLEHTFIVPLLLLLLLLQRDSESGYSNVAFKLVFSFFFFAFSSASWYFPIQPIHQAKLVGCVTPGLLKLLLSGINAVTQCNCNASEATVQEQRGARRAGDEEHFFVARTTVAEKSVGRRVVGG